LVLFPLPSLWIEIGVEMNYPNLLIVGAPKCGTTSLAYWLSQHHRAYLPAIKEPHCFSKDIYRPDRISKKKYYRVYERAKEEIKIDASTRYLYLREAIPEIVSNSTDAKFIAILRNPIEMIYSLHNHLRFLGVEHITDFEEAWRACEHRRQGRMIKNGCNDLGSLLYDEIGLLGEQINNFYLNVPPEKRKLILFDDLSDRPYEVLADVFNFSDLPNDPAIDVTRMNTSMARRHEWLYVLSRIAVEIKAWSGIK
jgi:hypothetical protein